MIQSINHPNLVIALTLYSSLALALGLAASYVLRRHAARAFGVLWLAMLAALLLPLGTWTVQHFQWGLLIEAQPTVNLTSRDEVIQDNDTQVLSESMTIANDNVTPAGASPIPMKQDHPLPWKSILLIGWGLLSLALLVRLIIRWISMIRLLGQCTSPQSDLMNCLDQEIPAHLQPSKHIHLLSHPRLRTPAIWCWGRQLRLLLPARSSSPTDWTSVFCHELAHAQRRDHIFGLISEIMVCLLPWQPLLWWAKHRLSFLSEQACDDWVLASGRDGTDYAESLLNLLPQHQADFVPALASNRHGVAGRIERILKNQCSNPRPGWLWSLGMTLAAIVLVAGIALAQTRPNSNKNSNPINYYGRLLFDDGKPAAAQGHTSEIALGLGLPHRSFSFTKIADVPPGGRFCLSLNEQQIESLQKGIAGLMVWIDRRTNRDIIPFTRLSQNKKHYPTVTITGPIFQYPDESDADFKARQAASQSRHLARYIETRLGQQPGETLEQLNQRRWKEAIRQSRIYIPALPNEDVDAYHKRIEQELAQLYSTLNTTQRPDETNTAVYNRFVQVLRDWIPTRIENTIARPFSRLRRIQDETSESMLQQPGESQASYHQRVWEYAVQQSCIFVPYHLAESPEYYHARRAQALAKLHQQINLTRKPDESPKDFQERFVQEILRVAPASMKRPPIIRYPGEREANFGTRRARELAMRRRDSKAVYPIGTDPRAPFPLRSLRQ